jgi:dihydrofolate synthase / folylpolyglutamate synthase
MQLEDWLNRLEKLHFKSIDMGLERIRVVAERLQLLSDTPFIFTIAGTNGKGSTVALINEFLRAGNHTTGVYTSPHLVRFNERVMINGCQCDDEQLVRAFAAVEAQRGDVSLTYFEFTTLAAIWLFKQENLDTWILEVGLGGRLDAVNVWAPSIAVVTSIDLDHQEWLGSDRTQIGYEKIGVGRAGRPLVIGEQDVPWDVAERAGQMGCQLYQQGDHFDWQGTESGWSATVTGNDGRQYRYEQLTTPAIYLQNAATALQALTLAPFPLLPSQCNQALSRVSVTGRRQVIHDHPRVMLDVGHNPHAAKALAHYLKALPKRRVHCVIGMLADKDILNTVLELLPVVDHWYPAELQAERAAQAGELRQWLLDAGARCDAPQPSPSTICRKLVKTVDKNDLILVFGSFYTVADVIQYSGLMHSDKD